MGGDGQQLRRRAAQLLEGRERIGSARLNLTDCELMIVMRMVAARGAAAIRTSAAHPTASSTSRSSRATTSGFAVPGLSKSVFFGLLYFVVRSDGLRQAGCQNEILGRKGRRFL